MAGFDFDFTYTDLQRPYVDACIRVSKTRARALSCSWRVKDLNERTMRCEVNGQTRRLGLLLRALETDLPIACEGVMGGLPPRRASRLGRGFAELLFIGRDVNLGDDLQTLREVKELRLYYPVYEFSPGASTPPILQARLRITEDVVTDFGLGRVEPVMLMEELHTAMEQTLRELLPQVPQNARWPTLVDRAEQAGHLSGNTGRSQLEGVPGHSHTDRDLLLSEGINTRRNRAKHGGGDPDDPWISDHWECLSLLLERLVLSASASSDAEASNEGEAAGPATGRVEEAPTG